MMPPSAAPAGLVWLASYPKSGNTWFHILLGNMLGGDEPQDINTLSQRLLVAAHYGTIDDHALLDAQLLRSVEVDRLRPLVHDAFAAELSAAVYVKTHDAYRVLDNGMPLLGRRARAAIYLVRDPRDVAVSFAFHNDLTIDQAIADLNSPDTCLSGLAHQQVRQRLLDWSGHVSSWLGQTDVPLCLIRYEDLLADTVAEFGRALAFLGNPTDAATLVRTVANADFAVLQQQERRNGFVGRVGAAPFFRSGRAGGWRQHLTADQLRAIESAHGAAMDRLGYRRETEQ